jgi:hypothetical protein
MSIHYSDFRALEQTLDHGRAREFLDPVFVPRIGRGAAWPLAPMLLRVAANAKLPAVWPLAVHVGSRNRYPTPGSVTNRAGRDASGSTLRRSSAICTRTL